MLQILSFQVFLINSQYKIRIEVCIQGTHFLKGKIELQVLAVLEDSNYDPALFSMVFKEALSLAHKEFHVTRNEIGSR